MKRKHSKASNYLLILIFLYLLLTATVSGQTDFGSLDGVIKKTDNISPAADIIVTLTDERSGAVRTSTTDAEGRYSFSGVIPSIYTISVDTVQETGVDISFGQNVTRNLTLVSSINILTIITDVTTQPTKVRPLLEPKIQPLIPGRIGTNLSARTAETLPVNTQPSRLPLLTAGAVNSGGASSTVNELSGFNFNGISSEQNVVRVNGTDVTPLIVLSSESFQDTAAFFTNISKRQSLAPFSTFRLDENNYPANLGTGTGGKLLKDVLKSDKKYRGDIYEYISDDSLTARNFFDLEKPSLRYHLFGARFSGPIPFTNKKLLFFLNYEGIRARSSAILFEAAPSSAARTSAIPSVVPLLNAFFAGGAVIIPGASADPNFDILKLETKNNALRNSITALFNYELNLNNKFDFYYSRDFTREDIPEGVTGRRQLKTDLKQTAILRYQELKGKFTSELILGLNITPSRLGGRLPVISNTDLSSLAVNVAGTVVTSGIPGQPLPLSIASPGGLLRKNRQFNGRGSLVTPYTFSLAYQGVWDNKIKFGGEVRFLRSYFNLLNGVTYNFSNITDLLQNRPSSVQLSGDLGSPSPFNTGAEGERKAEQEYFIGFAQYQWKIRANLNLISGIRYEYYTPVRESQDRAVLFDVAQGIFLPPGNSFYKPDKANVLPRIAISWAPGLDNPEIAKSQTVISASFGMHVGPAVFRDQIRPIESDRIDVTVPGGVFPTPTSNLINAFLTNPNRQYRPLAFDQSYTNAERSFKYDISLKRRIYGSPDTKEFFIFLAYVGNFNDRLPLRTFANRITQVQTNQDPTQPAIITREFDIQQSGNLLKPLGEIDVRTSRGTSRYDSFQIRLRGALPKINFALIDAQYTLARSFGNTNGGSQTATTGNPLNFEYDKGYNPDDVRHKFTFTTIYGLPFGRGQRFFSGASGLIEQIVADWTIGAIVDLQSGRPIDVKITRPDVVYIDNTGRIFNSPAIGRTAIINVTGGGASFNAQRPDLISGVNPYLNNDRSYLNPAAFAIPAPGTLGNLKRGDLRGPGLSLVDLTIRKQFRDADKSKTYFEFRVDVANLFNKTNFDRPSGTQTTLPNMLGTGTNQLQPGQPFTAELAPSFGILNKTFKREQDFSSSRQIQFSFVIYFNGGSEQLKP
jgi:hypothetical protein